MNMPSFDGSSTSWCLSGFSASTSFAGPNSSPVVVLSPSWLSKYTRTTEKLLMRHDGDVDGQRGIRHWRCAQREMDTDGTGDLAGRHRRDHVGR